MEAAFLIQPWVQAQTAIDCCKLCYQERQTKNHLECKRAHLAAYNTILAVLKLEKGEDFEKAMKLLSEAKETCLSTTIPNEQCHGKSQEALKATSQVYERILDDYKKRLPGRPPTTPRM